MLTKVLNTIRDLFTSRWLRKLVSKHEKAGGFVFRSLDGVDLHATTQQKYFLNCAAAKTLIGLNWCTVRSELWAATNSSRDARKIEKQSWFFEFFSALEAIAWSPQEVETRGERKWPSMSRYQKRKMQTSWRNIFAVFWEQRWRQRDEARLRSWSCEIGQKSSWTSEVSRMPSNF